MRESAANLTVAILLLITGVATGAASFDEKAGTLDAEWGPGAALQKLRVSIDGADAPANAPAESSAFTDRLGDGKQIVQKWGSKLQCQRRVRIYDQGKIIVIDGRIENASDKPIALDGGLRLEASGGGVWRAGALDRTPGSVHVEGVSILGCTPCGEKTEKTYSASQVLALASADHTSTLVVGVLRGDVARTDLSATFKPGEGGVALRVTQPMLGMMLAPGRAIDLDPVYLSASGNPWQALEEYGDAVARYSTIPPRKGPNALWCSWYAHRMAVSEDLVLKNAEVAAKHFAPLGLKLMQLDHGWQRADVTGDWTPNERFPHGLKWLSEELKKRYGLMLGVWIAPTDVAETSETFAKHPDWMLRDAGGKPLVNWKWYWKPNPNCYELDCSNPQAEKWVEEQFRNLTDSGVSYFKIDFIYACAGEHFVQSDPYTRHGWGVLKRAMQAVRRGAGEDAWIRYCQTPPLLSVGLASSAYGGDDTYDAGTENTMQSLRANARSLAAGWWINDRLYHREVCDMSIRMQADEEEARLRLSLMTLAGCSMAFSDEFQHLPASRIRMIQQCLPPGAPPMRPVDLLDRSIPSVWHLHCDKLAEPWEIVGLFNFDDEPRERAVQFADLGIKDDRQMSVFEFWEQRFHGLHQHKFAMTLPPHTARVLAIRPLLNRPQIIGTDMHVFQGWHDLSDVKWDQSSRTLSGQANRMTGLTAKIWIYVPEKFAPHFDFPLRDTSAHLTHMQGPLWTAEISFHQASEKWSAPFDAK